ncbi:MAG: VOC family protein [Candidatus Omnitrophota bacterium]|jgi:catechol 2,3-dioxygenase-like lactoylglutathione lyase family enzyme
MKAVRHIGIVTHDLGASLHFYKDLLGLKVIRQAEEPGEYINMICGLKGSRLTTVKMAADDGGLVELLCFHSHHGENAGKNIYDIGASHVAFTVKDIEAEYAKLLDNGVRFISSPQLSPDGYAKVAFCSDPNGVFVELVEEMMTR